MKQRINSADIFKVRKMVKFFKKINPENKDRITVSITIDNPEDEYTLLILSRLSELLPSGSIIPPTIESYVNTQCHFKIPHFHEMKKAYYQYKLKEISPWISLLALITSVIASTFSILTYLK